MGGIGEVCIAKDRSQSCPFAPPLLNSTNALPPPPHTLRVAIVIDASAAINGFDITILASHHFLSPTGIDLTNSVLLGTPVIGVECLAGVLKVGTACASTDTIDTVHLSASNALGSGNTVAPTTGLLFTAVYNVNGTVTSTPIGFQTGCSGTSTSGFCVIISNGSTSPNQETIQQAKFTDSLYFDFEPAFGALATLVIDEGGTNSTLSLSLTSINGFSGTVSLTTSSAPTGATVTLSANSVVLSPTNLQDNTTGVTVSISSTIKPGTYFLNFTATNGSLPPNNLTILLTVPTPDFAINANNTNPTLVEFNVSTAPKITIKLLSSGNFSGTVVLSIVKPLGLNATLARGSLRLPLATSPFTFTSNSTTVSVNSTIAGKYLLVVNATFTSSSLNQTHIVDINVNVVDFAMEVGPGVLPVPLGETVLQQVTFTSVPGSIPYNYTATIKSDVAQITANGPLDPATGITVTCSPTTFKVWANQTNSEPPVNINCSVTAAQYGNYTVTVIARVGPITHAIAFPVQVPRPDFSITSSATIQTVSLGKSTTFTVTVSRLFALNDTITYTPSFPAALNKQGTPPLTSINPQNLVLDSTHLNATGTITITTPSPTTTGTYFMFVSAQSKAGGTTHTLLLGIVVTTSTSPYDLEVFSVSPSTTSATVGATISINILVKNVGTLAANATVAALSGDLTVGQQNVTLAPGQNVTVTITWNTSNYAAGSYVVGGKISLSNGQAGTSSSVGRYTTPVNLAPANPSIVDSSYFQPVVIGVLIAVVAIVAILFLQARRKIPTK